LADYAIDMVEPIDDKDDVSRVVDLLERVEDLAEPLDGCLEPWPELSEHLRCLLLELTQEAPDDDLG
jgi:hypothetical protein